VSAVYPPSRRRGNSRRLYLDGHPDPGDETGYEFQSELKRLKNAGAYTGLL
jgi:hypothetical protein